MIGEEDNMNQFSIFVQPYYDFWVSPSMIRQFPGNCNTIKHKGQDKVYTICSPVGTYPQTGYKDLFKVCTSQLKHISINPNRCNYWTSNKVKIRS